MNDVLTLAAIEERYPAEWVLIGDPQMVTVSVKVIGGAVLSHSPDHDELYRQAMDIAPERCAVLYTGRPAEHMLLTPWL